MFCSRCGSQFEPDPAFRNKVCFGCAPDQSPISEKSYSTAVILAGVFGMIGIHHFYIGNILHGVIDLGLLVFGIIFILDPEMMHFGYLLLMIDAVHSFWIFIALLTGKQRDGQGMFILPPARS